MASPWDDIQKPNEKSEFHGKKDNGHGPNEHGMGAKKPDKKTDTPTLKDFLTGVGATDEVITAAGQADDDVLATSAFVSSWYQPHKPPILDQGTSPMCVAFVNSSDQAHMDRIEYGSFANFDEKKFFYQIGGGPDGAFVSAALVQRRDFGYPTTSGADRSKHKIAAFFSVDPTVAAVKTGLLTFPNNGSVMILMPWYHSWFHTLESGKLPYPDYFIGYHLIYLDGWSDSLGFRFRQSWGKSWGISGKGFLPYSFLSGAVEIWRTKDK